MTTFQATNRSEADVPYSRAEVWKVLTDPEKLARLTPLLTRIDAKGDTWTWHMRKITGLGVDLTPVFTEQMSFTELEHIGFTHLPPGGTKERFGADGDYHLADGKDGGAHLKISLTICAELPLPRAASPAVKRVMSQTMARVGDRFSRNLLNELGGN